MKLLADENQHPLVVAELRGAGYAVEWIQESSPGAGDTDILARTDIGSLVLLTYDRDFGDLVFNRKTLTASGDTLYAFKPSRAVRHRGAPADAA